MAFRQANSAEILSKCFLKSHKERIDLHTVIKKILAILHYQICSNCFNRAYQGKSES